MLQRDLFRRAKTAGPVQICATRTEFATIWRGASIAGRFSESKSRTGRAPGVEASKNPASSCRRSALARSIRRNALRGAQRWRFGEVFRNPEVVGGPGVVVFLPRGVLTVTSFGDAQAATLCMQWEINSLLPTISLFVRMLAIPFRQPSAVVQPSLHPRSVLSEHFVGEA